MCSVFIPPQDISVLKKIRNTHSNSIIMGDDVSDVQCDVGRWFQDFHFHLHVAQDAEVPVDEGLKFDQVVKRPQRRRQSHVQGLCGGGCCGGGRRGLDCGSEGLRGR